MFPKASNVRSMQIEFILLARVLCASSYFIFLFTHFRSLSLFYFSLAAQQLWRFLEFGFSFPFLRCNVNALSKQQSHVWCLHWKHRFADAIFHGISSGCHNWSGWDAVRINWDFLFHLLSLLRVWVLYHVLQAKSKKP